MIFSKLFKTKSLKPQWQSTDHILRIEAIKDELDPKNTEAQEILLRLLNNDNVEMVRRAALLKLNDFEVYLQASKNNTHTKIKNFAEQQIIKMLLNQHDIELTLEQKQQCLTELTKNSVLEAWLLVEQDPELIKQIYQQLNKPQLLSTLFAKAQSTVIQQFLIEQCQDMTQLEKLQKKALNDEIKKFIEDKIETLKGQTEKPIKAAKSIQLILSKLLALKDVSDYEVMLEKRQLLEQQWQALQPDFTLLNDGQINTFNEKYTNISQQLDKIFAAQKEQYQQQQIAKQIKLAQQHAYTDFNQKIESLNQQLVTFVFEDVAIDKDDFNQQLTDLKNGIAQSKLSEDDKAYFQTQLNKLQNRLSQLSEIAESVSEATHHISKISGLALPEKLEELNERHAFYQDWLKQWHKIEKQSDGLLPESIVQAYKEITQHWQQGLKPFLAQQEKLFQQTRKKLHDLKRLLHNGKYNTCFGLFKSTKQQFELLSGQQQYKLQRDFNTISEQIAQLSDWEHYIATPRKQELLKEINNLILSPCENPNEQADKVKQFRKQWNLLGHADDEIDQQLNQQFNDACEQAFAPCRAFYAEQEKLRAKNHEYRLLLIDAAEKLVAQFLLAKQNSTEVDYKSFDHQLTKLIQQWQKAGEVERSQYKPLLESFNKSLQPLKEAIHQYHLHNVEQKKQLIKQAELIAQYADSNKAIEEIKTLQQQWKSLGYAGPRKENKLWQMFRTVNDQIFAKRSQDKVQEKLHLNEKEHAYLSQLSLIEQQFADADKNTLSEIKQLAQSLNTEVIAHKPPLKKLEKQVIALLAKIEQQQRAEQANFKRQQWQNIFTLLTLIAEQNITSEELISEPLYNQITPAWQKRLQEVIKLEAVVDHQEKTLIIEILAGFESPIEYKAQRLAIQVALMQEQMTAGEKADLNALFYEWLKLGKLTKAELPQLARLSKIFSQ
jgi:hypothetical protein